MGTEVQSKMYIPSYFSMRDVSDEASNNGWSLHENKALMNGQYYDLFLTRQTVEGYLGYEKEQLRQTILRHESIFRHQLRELHRLYKRQRDLMDEIKSKDILKHSIPAGVSQSSLFSSCFTSDEAKKTWHIPDSPMVDSACGRPYMSCVESNQSPFSFKEAKKVQANGIHSQIGLNLKDCEVLESHSVRLPRRLIDLELPADDYICNEEEQLEEKVSGLSRVESYSHNRNCKVTCESNLKSHFASGVIASGVSSDCNDEASKSHLYPRETHGLTDLNKPIQVEEASPSVSIDIIGSITCPKEEISRRDLFMNSHSDSHSLPQNTLRGNSESIFLNNLHLENERHQKEGLSHKFGAGQTGSGRHSSRGAFCMDDLHVPSDSSQMDARRVHEPRTFLPSEQTRTGEKRKRTIFGVEISESDPDVCVSASHGSWRRPPVAQCDVHHSESSSISSWSKLPSCLSQSPISIRENSCSNRSHVSSNATLNPSFRAEMSYQNGVSLSSQLEVRESQISCQSNAFNYPNGFSDNHSTSEQLLKLGPMKFCKDMSMEVKPAKGFSADALIPKIFCNEVISRQNPGSVSPRESSISKLDEQKKKENSWEVSPWLKAKPLCNGESSKGKEASYQMNLDFLKTCSQTFAHKHEIGKGPSQTSLLDSKSETCDRDDEPKRIEVSDCHITKKILGIPIFCKPYDLSSPSSPSKSCYVASAVNVDDTQKVGLLSPDLGCDSSKSGELLKVEGGVMEKGQANQIAVSRHHIDLNLCVVEEEPPSVDSPPRNNVKKIAATIDLEAPVVVEAENVVSPLTGSKDEPEEHPDELDRVAAEAIIAISISLEHEDEDEDEDVASLHTSVKKGSLHWLADVISMCKGDPEKQVGGVSRGKGEDSITLNGLDYFELMTLNLTESKVEEYQREAQAEEAVEDKDQKEEEEEEEEKTARRGRKGQGKGRRGRQRKDFQRDILPSLASLSRYEITEDIHTIEELFKATGSTWESNLADRGGRKSGRGRRRLRSSFTHSPTVVVTTVCPPPIQQQQPQEQAPPPLANNRELGLEERSLTGWGKRTRRPPRQRYPNINPPPLALKRINNYTRKNE